MLSGIGWRGVQQWRGCHVQGLGQWQRLSVARAWSTAPQGGVGGPADKTTKKESEGEQLEKEKVSSAHDSKQDITGVAEERKGDSKETEAGGENNKEGTDGAEKGKGEEKVPFWVTFRRQPLYVQAYWALTVVATFVLIKEKVFDDPFWYSTKKRAREEIVKINESNNRFGPPDEGPRLDLSALTPAEKDALRRKALQKKLAKLREERKQNEA